MTRMVCVLLAAVFAAGCAGYFERSADEETLPLVDEVQQKVDSERFEETPEGVIEVKPEGPDPGD